MDIERLSQAALLLEQENARLFRRLERLAAELRETRGEEARSLQLEIECLEEQLASRTKALFGDSSERRACADDELPGDLGLARPVGPAQLIRAFPADPA